MSKPKLDSGLTYFPLDVHFINDDKIQSLTYEFGYNTAISLMITLYSMIYENNYFLKLNKAKLRILKSRLNIEIDDLKEVIESCLDYEIFNRDLYEKYEILTSNRIQLTYITAAKRRKKIPIITEYKLFQDSQLNETELETIYYIELTNSHSSEVNVNIQPTATGKMLQNSHCMPQSKVKESKGKEKKEKKSKEKASPQKYFDVDRKKIPNWYNSNEVYEFLQKYDIDLDIEFISDMKRFITNKQLLEYVYINLKKKDMQKGIKQNIKRKVDPHWYHFAKTYPKTNKLIDARNLFSNYDSDTKKLIIDSIKDYKIDLDGDQYATNALDYLESKIWKQYAV